MALRRIECPHCQRTVEIDITHVTRSRECPGCGKAIILQFTSKQKRAKRTALMVPSVDSLEKLSEAPHGSHAEPRALEGDPYHRMLQEPDVRRARARLIWGASIMTAVIFFLCVADYFRWWSTIENAITPPAEDESAVAELHAPSSSVSTSVPATTPPQAAQESFPVAATSTPPPQIPPPATEVIPTTAPPQTGEPPAAPVTPSNTSEDERAIRVMSDFLKARNVEERLSFVRDVKVMEPLIREYYTHHPDGPIPFEKIEALPKASAGSLIALFDVHLPGGTKRRATVGRAATGDYRVDWASFIIRSAMDWKEFTEKRPNVPVFMRVLAEPDSRYEGRFADGEWYLCMKLTNPLGGTTVHAYVQRKTPLGQSLGLILRTYPGEPMPMMLKLKFPPPLDEKASDQVLVEELIGEGWIARGM